MQRPTMWIKLPGQAEINCESITKGLRFLQDDSDTGVTNSYLTDAGLDGSLLSYQSIAKNTINANFWLHFGDWYDYKMKKHSIAKFFAQKGLMRIRTDAEPAIVKYVYAGSYSIKPVQDYSHEALFTVAFDNPTGLKYSLGWSDDEMTYGNGLWQVGMNLPNGKHLDYEYIGQRSFKIYNASDITVDPIQRHPMQIIVKNTTGQVEISNQTTGTSIAYRGHLAASDELTWDGVNCYLNGELANNDTDYTYLTLAPGYNDIHVSSTSDADIRFHFKFLYLD